MEKVKVENMEMPQPIHFHWPLLATDIFTLLVSKFSPRRRGSGKGGSGKGGSGKGGKGNAPTNPLPLTAPCDRHFLSSSVPSSVQVEVEVEKVEMPNCQFSFPSPVQVQVF